MKAVIINKTISSSFLLPFLCHSFLVVVSASQVDSFCTWAMVVVQSGSKTNHTS